MPDDKIGFCESFLYINNGSNYEKDYRYRGSRLPRRQGDTCRMQEPADSRGDSRRHHQLLSGRSLRSASAHPRPAGQSHVRVGCVPSDHRTHPPRDRHDCAGLHGWTVYADAGRALCVAGCPGSRGGFAQYGLCQLWRDGVYQHHARPALLGQATRRDEYRAGNGAVRPEPRGVCLATG